MAISEAKKRSNKKWDDANRKIRYDTLCILIPKGRKRDIKAYASSKGLSISGLISALLRADMGLTEREWKEPEQE